MGAEKPLKSTEHVPGHKATDDEIGDALLAQWNNDIAYINDDWYRYDPAGIWRKEVEKLIRGDVWEILKKYKRQKVSPNRMKVSSILDYVQSKVHVHEDRLKQNHQFINLKNGVYNLESHKLEPHRRDLYFTTQCDYAYDPVAQCPQWEGFLNEVITFPNGASDLMMRVTLQQAFGYSLTADTHLEKGFWLYGPAASGKSTIINVLKALLGDAATAIDFNTLDRNHYQLATLDGKRVACATEASAQTHLSDYQLKALISGEALPVREIYKRGFTLQPIAKLWWAMNTMPINNDRSNGLYRRLMIFPFHRTIPEESRDPQLASKLKQELPGIFNWALYGLLRLQLYETFTTSSQVNSAGEDYARDSDIEASFLDDPAYCRRKAGGRTQASALYRAYTRWCDQHGHIPKSNTMVSQDWKRLGLKQHRTSKGVYYSGIQLV